jgi:hypothetical protein
MTFARWVFRAAGIYGIVLTTPLLFLEERVFQDNPPPLTHAEYYYGFLVVVLAMQVLYLIISLDPPRYRQTIISGLIGKWGYAAIVVWLVLKERTPAMALIFAGIDFALGLLFLVVFLQLSKHTNANYSSKS